MVVNLHPALPGELPGTDAIERAWREAHAGGRVHTGVMVHLVPDEGVDDGPVLATATVPIHPGRHAREPRRRPSSRPPNTTCCRRPLSPTSAATTRSTDSEIDTRRATTSSSTASRP